MEEVAKRVEVDGIQAWWDLDPKDILGDEADQYVKVPDTLDVWFDSVQPTHPSWMCVLSLRAMRQICIWKVLTSTVAGSCLP
jgi:isoleucyl-tRNA synthetase